MTLRKKIITVTTDGSLDTKSDDKTLRPGQFTTLKNVSFSKRNSAQKRNGYTALKTEFIDGSGYMETSTGLHRFDGQLLNTTTDSLCSRVSSKDRWVNVGPLPAIFARTSDVSANATPQRNPVSITHDNLSWFAWEQSGTVFVSVLDQAGQTVIQDVAVSDVGQRPILFVADGNVFVALKQLGNIAIINVNLIVLQSLGFFNTMVISGISSDATFDVTVSGAFIYFALSVDSGTSTLVRRFNLQFGDDTDLSLLGTSCARAVDVIPDGTNGVWVASCGSAGLLLTNVDDTMIAATGPTLIDATQCDRVSLLLSNGELKVATQRDVTRSNVAFSGSVPTVFVTTVDTSIAPISSGTLIPDAQLSSKFFTYDDRTCVAVTLTATDQQTSVVLDVDDGSPLARHNVERAGLRSSGSLPTPYLYDATINWASERVTLRETDSDQNLQELGVEGISSLSLTSGTLDSVRFHDNLHFPGGVVRSYDGARVFEAGFLQFPEIRGNVVTPGSGSIAAGSYLYAFTFEWEDRQKQVHISTPSFFVLVDVPSDDSSVTFDVTGLTLTSKPGVTLVGYRSQARLGDTSLDTPLYRFTPIDSPAVTTPEGNLVVDTAADETLDDNRTLYTIGGIVENTAPPPSRALATLGNRLWALSTDDENTLFYSKTSLEGVPAEFAFDFFMNVQDDDHEAVTFMAALDSTLVIFKPTRTYATQGSGPTNLGLENDFRDPTPINSDVGCEEPFSVAVVPQGLLFKSRRGIQLLTRSFSVEYIGAPAEAFNDVTITRAVVVPDRDQVRFLTEGTDTPVWDYRQDKWCTHANIPSISGILIGTDFYRSRRDGSVFIEDSTRYDDQGVAVPLVLETGWMSLASLQGHFRLFEVRILGTRRGPHTLKLKVGFDNSPTYEDDHTELFDVDDALETVTWQHGVPLDFNTDFVAYQFGLVSGRRCRAVRVYVEDVQTQAQVGDAFSIVAISLEVGIEPGLDISVGPAQLGGRGP